MSEDSIELRDVCSLIKRGITPKYGENGLVVVNQRCIRNGVIELMNARIHDIVQRKVNAEKILVKDDILVNSTGVGTAGRVGMWIDSVAATCDTHVTIIRPLADRINPTFLFYFLRNMEDVLHDSAEGSTGQTELKRETIGAINTPCFRMSEQEIIAQVLCSLDDKIDLLKRQNKTLEGMAEALFRQWFIEEAQEDWEEVEFNTIAENVRNVMKPENLQGDVRLVGLEHFDSKSLVLNRYEQTNKLGSQKYKFEKGQIMFGKLRPYFHNISLPFFSGVCSTDILIIEARDDVWTIFAFFFLNQDWVVEAATQSASGTRMPRTNWNFLGSLPVLLPEVESLSEFNTIARPMIEKIEKNWSEIRILNQQRDTLLPKLMSGEVRVQMD